MCIWLLIIILTKMHSYSVHSCSNVKDTIQNYVKSINVRKDKQSAVFYFPFPFSLQHDTSFIVKLIAKMKVEWLLTLSGWMRNWRLLWLAGEMTTSDLQVLSCRSKQNLPWLSVTLTELRMFQQCGAIC